MSENKSKFPSRPKILAVSLAGILIALPAYAADNPPAEVTESSNIEALTVTGKRSADQKGADDVYYKNVSNAYVGKEYLERYRINAAGDVLKGLNGVYNMNTRTAGGAITPNIRGIAGKGRIPVTVDGTEQTIDVWMNNYGVVDRNYLDPALFRSIAVEKSPALTRGVKSGVGGAVIIRTIEAADIVPEGRKWGFQIATEQSNNAVKPQYDFTRWLGWDDYRTLPIGATADGDNVLGGVGTNTPQTLIFDQGSFEDPRRKNNRFGGDRYWQSAAAFKTDIADGLAAYSYRSKGNYYAGKAGAGGYRNNPIYAYSRCYETGGTDEECLSTATLVPNMAKMFPEGREVYNTNTETKTLLLKNNWHLPGSHKLGWQYMRSDIRFGEINPFQTAYEMTFVENNPSYSQLMRQNQNIDSKVRTDTYKLGWSWKPEGSRWLDLESSFWQIKTDTTRYQSGGAALVAANRDQLFDKWYWCTHRGRPDRLDAASGLSCDDLNGPAAPFFGTLPGFLSKTREEILAINPNDGRKFAVLSNAEQKTRITRTGFDLSNRFRLHPRLNMTLSADYQRERLSEESRITNSEDLLNLRGLLTGMTYLAGPRGGKRREWGTNLVFDWQATDRLKISAGIRYHNFSARDTALAAGRARRDPLYQAGGEGSNSYYDGLYAPYWQLAGEEEAASWDRVQAAWQAYSAANLAGDPSADDKRRIYYDLENAHLERFDYPFYSGTPYRRTNVAEYADEQGNWAGNYGINAVLYRVVPVFVPFRNGKLDSRAFDAAYGKIDFSEQVQDPQGRHGRFNRYLFKMGNNFGLGPCTNLHRGCTPERGTRITDLASDKHPRDIGGPEPGKIRRNYTEEQRWAQPETIKAHAWAPTIAVSYDLTDNQRLFARYAQATRFPSIYEVGSIYSDINHISTPTAPRFELRPEKSRSFEVGYSFDFSPYWSKLRTGNIRLTYYRNSIKNLIETTDYFRITQYDRKNTAGLELQTRFDAGSVFASLGGSYRLKQEICDRDTTVDFDPFGNMGLPGCIEGGYGSTRGFQAFQPKYSLNFDLGTRLLGERLELGLRGIYHSRLDNRQYNELIRKGLSLVVQSSGARYHWRPSLIIDAYGNYAVNRNFDVKFSVGNLTNRYYLDPMSNVPTPGPGRTVTFGLTAKF